MKDKSFSQIQTVAVSSRPAGSGDPTTLPLSIAASIASPSQQRMEAPSGHVLLAMWQSRARLQKLPQHLEVEFEKRQRAIAVASPTGCTVASIPGKKTRLSRAKKHQLMVRNYYQSLVETSDTLTSEPELTSIPVPTCKRERCSRKQKGREVQLISTDLKTYKNASPTSIKWNRQKPAQKRQGCPRPSGKSNQPELARSISHHCKIKKHLTPREPSMKNRP